MSALGWSVDEQTGNVVLTISQADWEGLLFTIGYAVGAAKKDRDDHMASRTLEMLNRLNIGNPNFTPYEVDK